MPGTEDDADVSRCLCHPADRYRSYDRQLSPNGSQVPLQENYQYSFHGTLWIADSKSGAVRQVKIVSGGPGWSAAPSVGGSAGPSTTRTGQLIGAGPETFVVVDPQQATAAVVARHMLTLTAWQLVAGGIVPLPASLIVEGRTSGT